MRSAMTSTLHLSPTRSRISRTTMHSVWSGLSGSPGEGTPEWLGNIKVPAYGICGGHLWLPRHEIIPPTSQRSPPEMTTSLTTTSLPLAPGVWAVDQSHSGVSFVVRHLGLSNVRGRFDKFDATLEVGSTLESVAVTAEIELASVATNNADRDAHLRSTDFFDTENQPVMTFRSTSVTGAGENYELAGDLTIAGITKPVTFDV